MDDLEFRRRIMSDPRAKDSEVLQAIRGSDANAKFADDIQSLDAQIKQALQVDVPDDLADRILFNQTESTVIKSTFGKRALSLAASVAFVFGLLAGQVNWGNLVVSPAQATLSQIAIEHVHDEMPFIAPLDEGASEQQINAKLSPFAVKLTEAFPYHVYYLNHCGFGDSNAVHLVFQGDKGKVTLFLTKVPTEKSLNFSEGDMAGMVDPVGDMSLILVGDPNENYKKIGENIKKILNPS
ncbi:DUF3379 domain-containing protein [Vibrio hippocampi]|uniref:DUF3379 domain-containing protein n=1 Tax=Vibrio hippocampi TaxID=654686 RepID=A0ABM8ZG53_9VIBR|nr:DUF3379 domain-containing protein [Vibrio hippocampi]CAH0525248.1 hypothetical protein VHP8226_00875 [Vibrio hippocampi]